MMSICHLPHQVQAPKVRASKKDLIDLARKILKEICASLEAKPDYEFNVLGKKLPNNLKMMSFQ
jgi:hypothetical protein